MCIDSSDREDTNRCVLVVQTKRTPTAISVTGILKAYLIDFIGLLISIWCSSK